jgi:hypothetical protein
MMQTKTNWLVILNLTMIGVLIPACGKHETKAPTTSDSPSQIPTSHLAPEASPTPAPSPSTGPSGLPPIPQAQLTNLKEILEAIGSRPTSNTGATQKRIQIAILDNGFTGAEQEIGKTLPLDTELIPGKKNPPQDTLHGTRMAQTIYAVATGKEVNDEKLIGPKLYLLNANGYSNFDAAVNTAIEKNVDIILYSQVWEYGGNIDGSGFINSIVNRAVDRGITWVNAAGNYGLANYSTYARTDLSGKNLILPHMQRYIRVVVPSEKTQVKFVLSWNDFSDDMTYRTAIDLDMQVVDRRGVELAKTELIQDGKEHFNDPSYTDHAREILRVDLDPGIYYLAVTTKNQVLSPQLKLRITADGYGVRFIDSSRNDSVLVPADNPKVVTVGAYDAPFSSEKRWLAGSYGKPDVWTVSRTVFSDGMDVRGTSTAAAVFAGALVLHAANGHSIKPIDVFRDITTAALTRTANHADLDAACRTFKEFAMDCPGEYPQAPLILRVP